MRLFLSSERNHNFKVVVNGDVVRCTEADISQKGIMTTQYVFDKKGPLKIVIIELNNSKTYRFIIDLFIAITSHPDSYYKIKALKFTKSKLELNIFSENTENEIRIHQVVKAIPFEVNAVSSFDHKIVFNGHFKGFAKKQIENAKQYKNETHHGV